MCNCAARLHVSDNVQIPMDERTLQELKNSPTEIPAKRKLSQGELSRITDIHSAPQNLFSVLLEMRKTSSSKSKQESKMSLPTLTLLCC